MENLNKMGNNQHDPAKAQEMAELHLSRFCEYHGLPLFIWLEDYPVPSRWHRHCDFSELALILSGTAVSSVPGCPDISLKAGDVLLLGTGTVHHLSRLRELRNYNILFESSLLDSLLSSGAWSGRFR